MIVFAHLLNDYSGSPRVLGLAINALRNNSANLLFIGSHSEGALSNCNLETRTYFYRRSRFKIVTLLFYIISQFHLFFKLLQARDIPKSAIVYVNSLLPFGAAIWGALTGRTVIYHLHETEHSPALLNIALKVIARKCATRFVYVSDDHRNRLRLGTAPTHVVANPIDPALHQVARQSPYQFSSSGKFLVLMLTSLRDYKGVPDFLELARQLDEDPKVQFRLVSNATKAELYRYFSGKDVPENVDVYAATCNPAEHYASADLVVNLTRPDECVETFGLTLIEAMAFGIPVIAPPVGGPTEIVKDGVEGFLTASSDMLALKSHVENFASCPRIATEMSVAARSRSKDFSFDAFANALRETVKKASEN